MSFFPCSATATTCTYISNHLNLNYWLLMCNPECKQGGRNIIICLQTLTTDWWWDSSVTTSLLSLILSLLVSPPGGRELWICDDFWGDMCRLGGERLDLTGLLVGVEFNEPVVKSNIELKIRWGRVTSIYEILVYWAMFLSQSIRNIHRIILLSNKHQGDNSKLHKYFVCR